VRADHTLDLSVAMATPPIRPHPARWLLAQPQRNGSSETTRQPRHTKRNETIRYNAVRNETRRDYTRRNGKGSEWLGVYACAAPGGDFSLDPCTRVYVRVRL
jgi:hypothetical protein